MAEGGEPNTALIPEDYKKKLKEEFEVKGMAGVKDLIEEKLDEWKRIRLNVAITGASGSGKSSFINTIRNLTADDDGAAAVGVTETTMAPKAYKHPDNKNLMFWDLPGVGTQNFKKEDYLKKVKFEKYDFFLIFSHPRFLENDVWLAEKIHEKNKKFFFVRTKIHLDIDNDKMAHPRSHKEVNIIEQIRKNCMDNFCQSHLKGVLDEDVFIIDNYQPQLYDFGKLSTALIQSAPAKKQEAMALSLSTLPREVIERKRKTIQKRIWKVAILSAAAGATPVPVLGEAVDVGIMVHEALFYRKQFGLNDEALTKTAQKFQMSLEDLKRSFKLKTTAITFTAKGLVKIGSVVAVSKVVEETTKFAIPVLGCFISGGISYGATVFTLRNLLNICVDDALEITKQLQNKLAL